MLKMSLLIMSLLTVLNGHVQAQVLEPAKIGDSKVKYAQSDKFKEYPVPVLIFVQDSVEYDKYKEEITERIIYPFLRNHDRSVAAVIVDFCPIIIVTGAADMRACKGKTKANVMIDVVIKEHNGAEFAGGFRLSADGHFDKNAYKNLLINPDYKTQSDSPSKNN